MNPAIPSGEKLPPAQPLHDGVCPVLLQLLTSRYLCLFVWIMGTRITSRGMGVRIK